MDNDVSIWIQVVRQTMISSKSFDDIGVTIIRSWCFK